MEISICSIIAAINHMRNAMSTLMAEGGPRHGEATPAAAAPFKNIFGAVWAALGARRGAW